jgi:hypothetical protein
MPATVVQSLLARGIQRIEELPVAAGQTINEGDFVCLNSSGNLIIASAANATIATGGVAAWSSGLTNLIVGRATENYPATANDPTQLTKYKIGVMIAEPGTQFLVVLGSGTAANAYPNQNLFCAGYPLSHWITPAGAGANTVWAVNIDLPNDATSKCQIVDFYGGDWPAWSAMNQTVTAPSTGTASQYPFVWIEFIGNQSAMTGARSLTRTN